MNYPNNPTNVPAALNVHGSFDVNGAGTVTGRDVEGTVVTNIARASVGRYTITFDRGYPGFFDFRVFLSRGAATGISKAQIGDNSITTGTLQIWFYDEQSPSQLADPVSCEVHFGLVLRTRAG